MSRATALLMLCDGPPVEFAATADTAAAATAVTKPAGLEVGDVVVVWALDVPTGCTLTTASGSAWTRDEQTLGASTALVAFWKVMAAADLANAWNLSGAVGRGAVALRYRGHGASGVSVKAYTTAASNSDNTLTLTGFTKAAGHYGVIALALSEAPTSTAATPAGFTSRRHASLTGWMVAAADRVIGYVDAATVSWTNMNADAPTTRNSAALLLEVTGP